MSEELVTKHKSQTNGWDVLKSIVNGVFNLIKIEKILGILVIYLIYRDYFFSHQLSSNTDFTKYLIDTNIINRIFEEDNTLTTVLFAIIILLVIVIIIQIIVTRFVYIKEINRLTEERKELMHGITEGKHEYISNHRSSELVGMER